MSKALEESLILDVKMRILTITC